MPFKESKFEKSFIEKPRKEKEEKIGIEAKKDKKEEIKQVEGEKRDFAEDSGFSFTERMFSIAYKTESKIGKVEHPIQELFEIKNKLKKRINKGKNAEQVIRDYIASIGRETYASSLIESLKTNKANCVVETALFLSLAEMLDHDLFEKCYVGYIPYSLEGVEDHIFIRKKVKRNEFENIDFGKTFPDSYYKDRFKMLPITKQKSFAIASLLINAGAILCDDMGKYEEAIKCYNEALKIDPSNATAWKSKGTALSKLIKYEGREDLKKAYNTCIDRYYELKESEIERFELEQTNKK